MTETSFDDFRLQLPTSSTQPSYARDGPLGLAPRTPIFIAPSLVTDVNGGLGTSVILVSAPAAVGKSVLAKELSNASGGLYWNLADYSLGSNFFIGTAVKQYGPEGFTDFLSEIRSGSRLLVLDAADEALVRAGRENYVAAIENLAEMLVGVRHPVVVIFGREDTIAETAAALGVCGITVSSYTVAYFTQRQAREFVFAKAERDNKPVVSEFSEFIDSFFGDVQHALGASSWNEARAFLGYAPVLDVVAEFYAEENNPIRVLEEVRRSSDDHHAWQLLHDIFHKVLVREEDKFARNFGAEDKRKKTFARAAFSPEAQVAYLLDVSLAPKAFAFGEDGEADWYANLESHLERQLSEHPFRVSGTRLRDTNPLLRFTNGAFRDFALAEALRNPALAEPEVMHSFWRSPEVNPTPILSGLIFANAHVEAVLPSQAFGMIHDSHASSESRTTSTYLFALSEFSADGVPSTLLMERWHGSKGRTAEIRIDMSQSLPAFDRMVARSMIEMYDNDVRFGDGFSDFLLGPDVMIIAKTLSSTVPEVRVRSAQDDSSVILSVSDIGGFTRRVSAKPISALKILSRGKSLPHPWYQFVVKRPPGVISELDSISNAMEVRRLVMWFSKPSMFGGGLRYPVTATDALVAKNRLSANLVTFLLAEGYMTKNREEYVLVLPVATRSILDNRAGDEKYSALLSSYADWKRVGDA